MCIDYRGYIVATHLPVGYSCFPLRHEAYANRYHIL